MLSVPFWTGINLEMQKHKQASLIFMKTGFFQFVLSIKHDQTPLRFINMVVEHKTNKNRFSAASNPIDMEDKKDSNNTNIKQRRKTKQTLVIWTLSSSDKNKRDKGITQ